RCRLSVAETGWIPARRPPHNPGMQEDRRPTHHHVFDTAIGPCGVAWNARGLVAVQLPEKNLATTERRLAAKAASAGAAEPPAAVAAVIDDIRRCLAGEPVDFSKVAVDLSALDLFRRRLYETMRSLRWGETTTYGELARKL